MKLDISDTTKMQSFVRLNSSFSTPIGYLDNGDIIFEKYPFFLHCG